MRAAVITRPGGPSVIEIREVADPFPGPQEVLVRIHASALNRADLLQREGRYPAPPGWPADVPGLEIAGEVAQLGGGAERWRVRDRVFGIVGGGGNAELVAVHENTLAPIPAKLSWEEAAAVPEAFITAHDALVTQAHFRAGDHVLVHAVGSGVGLAAVQLARAFGGRAFGTARSADKIERAREHGLHEGFAVGGDLQPMVEAVRRWSGGRGANVTLDLLGGPYTAASILASAPGARIMLVGTIAGSEATIPLRQVLGKRLTLRGTVLRARSLEEKIAVTAAFVRDVVPLLSDGRVRPVVDRVFALDEIAEGHAYLESNVSFGKVVLRN